MQSSLTLIGGAGLGAALMYLFDVDRGRRHRALLRDQVAHIFNATGDTLDATTRDAGHRLTGLFAETRSRLLPEDVSDEVLVERLRAKLGRIVSHPSGIEVAVSGGNVVVSGSILAHETDRLLSRLRSIPGVRSVSSRLREHAVAGDVPGLQGEGMVRGEGPLARQYWPPSARFTIGALGGALALAGPRRGGFLATLAAC